MRYLFFDLEFATSFCGAKICEFGYVITDEFFHLIERNNYIIDPNIYRYEWDDDVVNHILTRSISEYERAQFFPNYYDRIVELIKSADYIIGHTMSCDASALNDDCLRYHKDSIDFEFYDIKEMYKEFSNTTNDVSVVNLLKKLNITVGEKQSHDAENDAYNTMLELKAMLDSLQLSFPEFIELCPDAKDENRNYAVLSKTEVKSRKEQAFLASLEAEDGNELPLEGEKYRRFRAFLGRVVAKESGRNRFKKKRVCLSLHYESHHFRQMLNLIQLVANEGGEVVIKPKKCNVFVQYDLLSEDGEILYDKHLNLVKKMQDEEHKNVEILSFSDFLTKLGITEEELDEMPLISFDYMSDEFVNPTDNEPKNSSIGELLKAQGLDLSKLFEE